jgi:hypothetical protein
MNHKTTTSLVALAGMALITGACMKHEVHETGTAPPPTVVKESTSAVAPGGSATPASEDVISLPASMGTVSFPHKMHQDLLKDCSKCHEKGPGKIDGFGKEWAHARCKGCHQDMKQGPTSCTGCHKK